MKEEEISPEDGIAGKAEGRIHGIAICLSGGGYRAALFHLGVLRCLHEMGILQEAETISSVSGGSIISAFLAKKLIEGKMPHKEGFADWQADVSDEFKAFVKNDIRTIPFFAHILWNWLLPSFRARHLQRLYRKKLTSFSDRSREIDMGMLPDSPKFTFCATDLSFGVNWIFTRDEVGDYQVGYCDGEGWPLANAVAASSCFPPIFGPITLNLDPQKFKRNGYRKPDRESLLSRLPLTDGGVYDNLGLEPVIENHRSIFISDGGAPFSYSFGRNPLKRILRYTANIMDQALRLRRRLYFTGITKKWHTGAYMSISHGKRESEDLDFPCYSEETAEKLISGIRTDLDRFSSAEAEILENHGYFITHKIITRETEGLIENPGYQPKAPYPEWLDEARVKEALKWSGWRISPLRLLKTLFRR